MSKSPLTTRLGCEALEARDVPAFLTPVVSTGAFSAVGDFNRDGRSDLVVFDQTASTVAVRLAQADGTFRPAGPAVSASGFKVAAGDFDGDGNRDVLVVSSNGLALLRGNGDGTLRPAVATSVRLLPVSYGEQITAVEVADANNDGRPDVLVREHYRVSSQGGGGAAGDYLVALLARPDGTFAAAGTLQTWIGLGQSSNGVSTATPSAFYTGDFDGDGKVDLLFVASAKGTKKAPAYPSQILRGNGNGTFDTDHPLAENWVNVALAVGDVNGDGKTDVIESGSNGTWNVLVGSGNGTFKSKGTVSLPAAPVVADVNGDSKADLVSVDPVTGAVSVVLGNKNGTFQAPRTFAGGLVPVGGISVGDFNGGGQIDIAIGNGSSISVLLNDGRW